MVVASPAVRPKQQVVGDEQHHHQQPRPQHTTPPSVTAGVAELASPPTEVEKILRSLKESADVTRLNEKYAKSMEAAAALAATVAAYACDDDEEEDDKCYKVPSRAAAAANKTVVNDEEFGDLENLDLDDEL
jgi:hypothetical protein